MQQTVIRVLLVEDNTSDAQRVQDALTCANTTQFSVEQVANEDGALACLARQSVDVVVLEFGLCDGNGFDILARLRTAAPEIPVVVLSNRADEDLSLQAVHAGAQDYLVKGQVPGLLVRAIRHAVERAQAENAMRSVKARLQRTIDGTNDGLWDWLDVSTHSLWWSPSYYKQLGFEPDEVTPSAKLFRSLLHPDDIESCDRAVAEVMAGQRDIDWEFRIRHRDGQYLWFKARGRAYRDGTRVGVAGSNTDITQHRRLTDELERHRHHLEEMVALRTTELREARRLADAANEAKSMFLANMSHEIRTPLHAILGFVHLLRRDTALPQQVERLDKIKSAGQHLLDVINDILDISKIEARRLELEAVDFNLACVFDNVSSILGQLAQDKGLHFSFDWPSANLWLNGDPTRLGQALLNYAANAVKFTDAGSVWIRVRVLQDDGAAVCLRFEVQDTGSGITPEKLDRLFLPFGQADASTTRSHGGSGLGLVITRRLAQLMGGDAGASSREGEGSTFWFTARVQRGHTREGAKDTSIHVDPQAELLGRHGGKRILVADDDPFNREIARDMFDGMGLKVDTVANGQEAVAAAQSQHYDLILMDVQMPVMDGLEATRVIRQIPGWERRPILAMTANVFAEDRRACLDCGMSDVVPKPIEAEDLYFTLLKWLPAASLQ